MTEPTDPPGGASTFSPPPPVRAPKRNSMGGKRPALALVFGATIGFRLFREVLSRSFGFAGFIVAVAVFLGAIIGWRLFLRARARRNGGEEYTPEMVQRQLADSGVSAPAFAEDGTLLGASVLVVNQRSKLIEVVTEYQVFDSTGAVVAHVAQIGQSGVKKFFRFVLSFDQFMTHRFAVTDPSGYKVLEVVRPRKWFKSRIEVHAEHGFVGRVVQQNVFGHINFGMFDGNGTHLATLKAENWRAWDFRVELPNGQEVARVTKTWEGFARTIFTNADTYVVRIGYQMPDPLRTLVIATALTVDLALKQDARGIAG